MHLSEQEIQRRQEREELKKMGIDPYPAELLRATIEMGSGPIQDWSRDEEQEPDMVLEPQS